MALTVECIFERGVGFLQCPPDWHRKDPGLEAATEGTLGGALVRLVGGYNPANSKWSRTRHSAQLSRNLELGWSHMASRKKVQSDDAQELIHKIAREYPESAARAWGDVFAAKLADRAFVDDVFGLFDERKLLSMDPRAQKLIDGWNVISKTPQGSRAYAEKYWDEVVIPMAREMQKRSWNQKRTLAAATRMRNTSIRWTTKLFRHPGTEQEAVDDIFSRWVADKKHHRDDGERVESWPQFKGTIREWPSPPFSDISVPGSPYREGGFFDVKKKKSGGGGAAALAAAFAIGGAIWWTRRR